MAITKVTSGLISADASSIDLNIDAGTLYLDVSENKVGIGTTSPTEKLSTVGNVNIGNNDSSNPFSYLRIGATQYGAADIKPENYDFHRVGLSFHVDNTADDTINPTEAMRITSAGLIGIGTSSPDVTLDVVGNARFDSVAGNALRLDRVTSGNNIDIDFYNPIGTAGVISRIRTDGDGLSNLFGAISFHTGTTPDSPTEAMRINRLGDIGIGTDSPTGKLGIYGGGINDIPLVITHAWGSSSTALISASNASSEVFKVERSGNVLVGTTDTAHYGGSTNSGFLVAGDGLTAISRSAGTVLYLNRQTSDGDIITFRKDGSTVGSIANTGTSPIFRNVNEDGISIITDGGQAKLVSTNSSGLADNDGDIGAASYRWDDIYATNGTIQTSDRNDKQDIAELSDAEIRVAVAAKGLLRKFRWQSAVEEKGDEARIHFGIIAQDLQDAFTAEGLDAGDYAMFISSTWTDEETGEEKTRLGVRYSELLAFIIASI